MKESPGVKKQQLLQTLSHSVGGGGVPKNVTTNKLAPLILVCMLWDLTVYLKVPSGLNMQFTAIKKNLLTGKMYANTALKIIIVLV